MNIHRYFKFGYEFAKCIEDESIMEIKYGEPTRDISMNKDPNIRSIEKDGFNIKYQ